MRFTFSPWLAIWQFGLMLVALVIVGPVAAVLVALACLKVALR